MADKSKLVQVAAKYLGVKQGTPQWSKFTNGVSEAWCADFVSYVANEAGLSHLPKTNAVETLYKDAVKKNKFTKYPSPGDVIIYGKGNNEHTGIVESYNPKTGQISTIEGNTSMGKGVAGRGVARKNFKYSPDDSKVSTNSRGMYVSGFYNTGTGILDNIPQTGVLGQIWNKITEPSRIDASNKATIDAIMNSTGPQVNVGPAPNAIQMPKIAPAIMPDVSGLPANATAADYMSLLPQAGGPGIFDQLQSAQNAAMAPTRAPQVIMSDLPQTAYQQPVMPQTAGLDTLIPQYAKNSANQVYYNQIVPKNALDVAGQNFLNAASGYTNDEAALRASLAPQGFVEGLAGMVGDVVPNVAYTLGGGALGAAAGVPIGAPEITGPAAGALVAGGLGASRELQRQRLSGSNNIDLGAAALQGGFQGLTSLAVPGIGKLGAPARIALNSGVDAITGAGGDILSQGIEQQTLTPKIDVGRTLQSGAASGLFGGLIEGSNVLKQNMAEGQKVAAQKQAAQAKIDRDAYVRETQINRSMERFAEQAKTKAQAEADAAKRDLEQAAISRADSILGDAVETVGTQATSTKGVGKQAPQAPEELKAANVQQTVEAPKLVDEGYLSGRVTNTRRGANLERRRLIEKQGVHPDDIYTVETPDKKFLVESRPKTYDANTQAKVDQLSGQFNAKRQELLSKYGELSPQDYEATFKAITDEYTESRRRLIQGELLTRVESGLSEAELKATKTQVEKEIAQEYDKKLKQEKAIAKQEADDFKSRQKLYENKPVLVNETIVGRVVGDAKGRTVEVELPNGERRKFGKEAIQPLKPQERKDKGLAPLSPEEINALRTQTKLPLTKRLSRESNPPRGAESVNSAQDVAARDPYLYSTLDTEGIKVIEDAINANNTDGPGKVVELQYQGNKTSDIGRSKITPQQMVYFPAKTDAKGRIIKDSALGFVGVNENGYPSTYFLHEATRRSDQGYSTPTFDKAGKMQVKEVAGTPQYEYKLDQGERTKAVETVKAIALRNELRPLVELAKEANDPTMVRNVERLIKSLGNASKVSDFHKVRDEIAMMSPGKKNSLQELLEASGIGKC